MINVHENHDIQNTSYITAKAELFAKNDTSGLTALANYRLNKLVDAMANLTLTGDYVEAVDTCVSFFDDVILECAELTNRRVEIEHKIIELCKSELAKATERNAAAEHVTSKLIDGLNAKPSAEAAKIIEAAILDDTNPLRLGFTYYAEFCAKFPSFGDANVFEYVTTEVTARAGLIMGNDQEAFNALEHLLKSPIETPEKYLLASLNSYYHGFEKDAINALSIGLARFPNNERLMASKAALTN